MKLVSFTLALLVLPLVTLVTGCGQPRTEYGSSLQTYDSMRGDLAWVTSQSARLAGDMRQLDVRVRSGNVAGSRRHAVQLKLDALAFAQGAGHFGNELRRLSAMRAPGPVHAYLEDLCNSLSADWYEGKALAQLTNVVWADPLALVPSTSSRIARFQSRAKQFALKASAAARRGEAIRQRDESLFRYSPVKRASASG
jgi:hypothetical protein